MYYNILTGLQTGFRVKIVNFDNSVVSQFPEETWAQRKPNVEKWPESLRVIRILIYRMLAIKIQHLTNFF